VKGVLRMVERAACVIVLGITIALCGAVEAGPPLPLHNIEGNSGVLLTNTAYLANPPGEGARFGLPSFSISGVLIGEKDLQSYAVTQNLFGNIELGYAAERLGLGDWSDDVKMATGGTRVSNRVWLHNLNLRLMAVSEGGFDCDWMPAITFGTHFKWNDGIAKIDRQLNGLVDMLGSDHTFGTEFTAVASKTITDLLPRPVILSAGLRNGDAIHTGFLGFAGERRTTFEGSAIVLLTDRLAFASEYRQKSDHLDQLNVGPNHLVKAENDWWDLLLAYVVNDHMTVSGGYINMGNVLNTQEDDVWALQLKYEF
jgi:hypothetical protein